MGDSTNPQILPLEGVENLRDFGGYVGANGGRMVRGIFWRSGHHGKATDRDLVVVERLSLTTVLDLRRPQEREAEPSRRPTLFTGEVIDCDLGDRVEAPHVAFLRQTDLTAESARAFFLDYYEKAPFEPRHLILFRRYFEALDRGAGPVLIHCTAGKDRTGLLASLTHHVLGVHHDDAIADYVLTNHAVRIDARLPVVTASLEQSLGKRPSEAAVRAFLGVQADYLDAAMSAISQAHGSIKAYLADIGVTSAMTIRLRDQYLS